MITSWQIYWLSRLDYFGGAFTIASILFGLVCAGLTIFAVVLKNPRVDFCMACCASRQPRDPSHVKPFIRMAWVAWPFFIFCLVCALCIPSTKEMAAIILIPKIANNAQVQKLPGNILELANEWIEELKPTKHVEK